MVLDSSVIASIVLEEQGYDELWDRGLAAETAGVGAPTLVESGSTTLRVCSVAKHPFHMGAMPRCPRDHLARAELAQHPITAWIRSTSASSSALSRCATSGTGSRSTTAA